MGRPSWATIASLGRLGRTVGYLPGRYTLWIDRVTRWVAILWYGPCILQLSYHNLG